eukprot:6175210-Pleurochrysis_carterae.AAC.1
MNYEPRNKNRELCKRAMKREPEIANHEPRTLKRTPSTTANSNLLPRSPRAAHPCRPRPRVR